MRREESPLFKMLFSLPKAKGKYYYDSSVGWVFAWIWAVFSWFLFTILLWASVFFGLCIVYITIEPLFNKALGAHERVFSCVFVSAICLYYSVEFLETVRRVYEKFQRVKKRVWFIEGGSATAIRLFFQNLQEEDAKVLNGSRFYFIKQSGLVGLFLTFFAAGVFYYFPQLIQEDVRGSVGDITFKKMMDFSFALKVIFSGKSIFMLAGVLLFSYAVFKISDTYRKFKEIVAEYHWFQCGL